MSDPTVRSVEDDPIRVRLDLAYDGTRFAGWAKQADGLRTVQGELEHALAIGSRTAGPDAPTIFVAGRTDAGVHAVGQVAHVDLTAAQLHTLIRSRRAAGSIDDVARRLNGLLGSDGDVVVHRTSAAPAGFDARFSALWRRYRYRLADPETVRDPLFRNRTALHPTRLDEARMHDAVQELLGLHDFAAFCRARAWATTIRTLQRFSWARDADGLLVAEVQADAFCHSMVRSLVGASIAIGAGRMPVDGARRALEAAERSGAWATAPAKGLTLIAVGYPPDGGLAEQASRARATRAVREGESLRYA